MLNLEYNHSIAVAEVFKETSFTLTQGILGSFQTSQQDASNLIYLYGNLHMVA